LDTSVVIDIEKIDSDALPDQMLIASVTLAELASGPHATDDPTERARRQDRLQRAEAAFESLPFDNAAARAYGRVYAAALADGRKPRGGRALDLLIAAVALAEQLPLFTRNPADFASLGKIMNIVPV
jgi:predicted nucleic acid-binding protein